MWPPGGNASWEITKAPLIWVSSSSTRSACSVERTMTRPSQRIAPRTTRSPSTTSAPSPHSWAPGGTVTSPLNWVMVSGVPKVSVFVTVYGPAITTSPAAGSTAFATW